MEHMETIATLLGLLVGVIFVGAVNLGRSATQARETANELRKIGEELRKHNQREDRLHR